MNMGILGAGGIATKMAQTITKMETVVPYAVAARELDRAECFARTHGIQHAYGSYEEMLRDPAVELVYIATPHSHHSEQMLECIAHGKHVLCEKAFTVNADQAEEVFRQAAQKGVLVTEAIWTRYMPMYATMQELLEQGAVGKVYSLTANLGYNVKDKARLRDPALAGGALLDIGVYPLNFAAAVFGDEVTGVSSGAVLGETGVDLQNHITLEYGDRLAVLYSTMQCVTDRRGVVYGEDGYLVVENINNPERITVYTPEWKERSVHHCPPEQISGYKYEVTAAMEAIRAGKLECPQMPHKETLRIMRLMDSLREAWGVEYPCG